MIVATSFLLAWLTSNAIEHEETVLHARFIEAEANLHNEARTQPPVGCRVNEDGSATCQDDTGGWHFDVSPW